VKVELSVIDGDYPARQRFHVRGLLADIAFDAHDDGEDAQVAAHRGGEHAEAEPAGDRSRARGVRLCPVGGPPEETVDFRQIAV
jgi:hypothetical protein